jgi:hypothetical protein
MLDEVWVDKEEELDRLRHGGVTISIRCVPIPVDTEELGRIDDVEPLDIPELNGNYVFYLIAEHNEKNNILEVCTAFQREFRRHENVGLIIKSYINGMTADQSSTAIYRDIMKRKEHMRLYSDANLYHQEVIITQGLNRDNVLSLHKRGGCYIDASSGNSISEHKLIALYCKNAVICNERSNTIGEFLNFDAALDVTCVALPPIRNIYTAWETWHRPNVLSVAKQMRHAYENRHTSGQSESVKKQIQDTVSERAIAKKIEEILDGRS